MKKLVLDLTGEQFARLSTLAKLLQAEPAQVAAAVTFCNLDAYTDGGWGEWENVAHTALEFYCERQKPSDRPRGKRIEDIAPPRRLRIARRSAKGVRHV